MTMKLYSLDTIIHATLYIKADSAKEAQRIADDLIPSGLELHSNGNSETETSECRFDDPDLPEISLSPAMTIGTSSNAQEVDQ